MTNVGAYGKGLQRGKTWKWQPGVFPTTPLWKLCRKCHYREVLTHAHVVFWLDGKIQKFFNKCIASKICQRWDFSSCSLYRHYLKHHTMHQCISWALRDVTTQVTVALETTHLLISRSDYSPCIVACGHRWDSFGWRHLLPQTEEWWNLGYKTETKNYNNGKNLIV